MKKTFLIAYLLFAANPTMCAQQLDSLELLYSDNSWERLDNLASLYIDELPKRYEGYYYKAIAKCELQYYDSALYFLDAGLPHAQNEHLLKYMVAYGPVYTGQNELTLADSIFASAENMISDENRKDAYSLYDLWAENRWFAGQPFESEALLRKGLAYLDDRDFKLRGRLFNNLGIVNWELGKFNESLNFFEKAEDLYRQEFGEEDPRVAKVINNQGVVYLDLGDYKKAEYHFKSARDIQNRVYEGNAPDAYMTYNNLAHIALREGDLKEAYSMAAQSLEILNEAEGSAAFRMNEPLEVQAAVWREMKDYNAATEVLESAIALMTSVQETHSGLVPLYEQKAEILLETYQLDEAYNAIAEAIHLFQRSNSASHPKLGELYALNAQICLALHKVEEANLLAKDALKVYANYLPKGTQTPLDLEHYRVSKGLIKAAEAMGDVFFAQGLNQESLKAWRMGLNCVDQLRRMTAYVQSRMNLYESAQSLNTKYVSLLLSLNEGGTENEMEILKAIERGKAFSLNLRSHSDSTSDSHNELMTRRAYWERQLYNLDNEKKTRQAQMELLLIDNHLDSLRTDSPSESPFSLLEQRIAVSAQSALLSFYHRDSLTLGVVVVGGNIVVKRLHAEDLTRHVKDFNKSYADLNFILSNPQEADSVFEVGSRELYTFLIEPFEEHISDKENWIVSADNALLNLNFGLLANVEPANSIDYSTHPYLLLSRSISYVPSLYMLGEAREVEAQTFSVWNFNVEDSQDFAQEVDNIREFFDVDLFESSNCSETNFKSQASHSSLIHIGCHGESGKSAFETRIHFAPDSLNDGELTFAEVGWMNLNAKLVTLSACRTGSGITRSGEWTQSVAYGFMSAGCPTIISSSWDIPDDVTQKITSLFYENLAEGNSSFNALRQAQISVLSTSDKLHAHPYYWAGMIHQGDELVVKALSNRIQWKLWVFLGLVFISGLWIKRKRRA